MRVGILTFSDFNTNYGSMLQALSLKLYLESIGHHVIFIRYREYHPVVFKFNRSSIKGFLYNVVYSLFKYRYRRDINASLKNFNSFKRCFFEYTSLYLSNEELSNMKESFDVVVCGSDQLWNLQCLGGLRTPYFLEFVPKGVRKIFYAVSMGDYHFSFEDKKVIKPLLDDCEYVSIREKENISEVQEITKTKVHCVVDPVFLTSSQVWNQLANENLLSGSYGVCYFVRRSKFGNKIVKQLLAKYKMPIINLSDNMIYVPGTDSTFISVGPIGFISLIKNAKFVVGTSFHLAAFSIIFNVPAIICGLESNRSRIMNIFDLVDLQSHFITPNSDLSILDKFLDDKIDYTRLKKSIHYSKNYLENALDF